MRKNSNIFDLIHSMTQNEKRYFKIYSGLHFANKSKNYIELFDAFDQLKVYDEVKLLGKIKTPSIKKYFAQVKRNLFVNILKSLRSYHGDATIESQIASSLHDFEILHGKALFKLARKALNKAKDLANQYERNADLVKIYSLETKLLRSENKVDALREHTEKANEEVQTQLNIINNTMGYDQRYAQAVQLNKEMELVRSKQEQSKILTLLTDNYLQKETNALTVRNKIKFHYINGIYQYFLGDFQKAASCFEQHIQLFHQNSEIIKEQEAMYLRALQNGAFMDIKSHRFNAFLDKMSVLKDMDLNNETLDQNRNYAVYLFSLMYYNEIGRFDWSIEFIDKHKNRYKHLEQWIQQHNVFYEENLYLKFASAIAYLAVGEGKLALKQMNSFLNNADKELKQDAFGMANVLNLIIHYELGNEDLLDYTVKSTIKYLSKREKLYAFESEILNFLQSATTTTNSKAFQQALGKLHQACEQIQKDPIERNAYAYFDFSLWVKSKVAKRSLADTVQEQFKGSFTKLS